jgi:DNA modification methylase
MSKLKPPSDDLQFNHPCSLPGTGAAQIVLRNPAELRANPRNARTHSKRQIRQLANTIKAVGFIGVIVIDETDTVLAGHARLEASELAGMHLVPTLTVMGLSEAQKRIFVLADNKIAAKAGWDFEVLRSELGELAELLPPLNWDLTLTGFEPAEIDAVFIDHDDAKPDAADTVPSLNGETVTRHGDLWQLGPHRVLCGEARSNEDVDRLMANARARMAFLEPPDNVQIADVNGGGQIQHPECAFASGALSAPEYVAFLQKVLGNAARVSVDGAVHFVSCDWRRIAELITAGRTVYGAMLDRCIWADTITSPGSPYRSQCVDVGVFLVRNGAQQSEVQFGRSGRNRSNLWRYAGVNGFAAGRAELHEMRPSIKPVALIADAMRDCTTKGDLVLDLFAGSGSTILAAEKIGRRAYALEVEPRCVDVATTRWEVYAKAKATLDGDGRTFSEIQAERRTTGGPALARPAAPSPHNAPEGPGGKWGASCGANSVMSPETPVK